MVDNIKNTANKGGSDTLEISNQSGNLIIPTAEEIYEFVFDGTNSFEKYGIQKSKIELFENLIFSPYPVDPVIVIENIAGKDTFEPGIRIQVKTDEVEFEVEDYLTRTADHFIHEGTWYPFTKGSQRKIVDLLKKAGIQVCGNINLKQYLNLLAQGEIKEYLKDKTGGELKAKEIASRIEERQQPISLKAKLYPYQETGYRWLAFMASNEIGCILGDEMGLGKTLQVIAVLCERSRLKKPSLIIAPATLLENWRREISKFAPDLTILKHHGSQRSGIPAEIRRWDVVLTSYETASRDIYMLKMIEWDLVVLDEAQAIKNPDAIRAIKSKKLNRTASIAVTGTPMQNRLMDLWSLTDFCLPGYLGDRQTFDNRFTDDPESAKSLEPLVTPILLRRTIREVAQDLPEKIEIPQAIEMDEESALEYDGYRKELIEQYGGRGSLASLTKLRQFCTHPQLVGTGEGDLTLESQKYLRLTEILEEIFEDDEKVLIFTSYVAMIQLMKEDVSSRYGVYCNFIDGSVGIDLRQGIIDEFSKSKGPAALILNPNAAGVGLNITAANHVIHYNLEWNPAVEDQATGRAYRRGQTLPVRVYRLYYINTVEEVINERIDRKRDLYDKAIGGVEGSKTEIKDIWNAIQKSPLRSR